MISRRAFSGFVVTSRPGSDLNDGGSLYLVEIG